MLGRISASTIQIALVWSQLIFLSHALVFPSLLDASLTELTDGLTSGLFTSTDLVTAYIHRIQEVNPSLHAITELNPDAFTIATHLDALRAQGTILGPLHGIPLLIKDNIATLDKMNTTSGSFALLGAKVPRDSTIATKLRNAGAIILGKTNLSEWAQARGMNISSGWSAYGGQTVAGYFPRQDPSGSSSGSGVAASLGLGWATLGTETAGSIVFPAHANNVVGIKPTVGLTSRYLVVPISEHQDTVGPLARTVKDAAYLLQAIVGRDARDNYTNSIPYDDDRDHRWPDYVAACRADGLAGKRIGVARSTLNATKFPGAKYGIDTFDAALDVMRAAGATIVDNITFPGLEPLLTEKPYRVAVEADMMTAIARYFGELVSNPHNITDLASLADFTRKSPKESYPERDIGVWDAILEHGIDNRHPSFWGNFTRAQYLAGPQGLTGALANHSLDAIVSPTEFGTVLAALLGTPIVNVPLGRYPEGTPIKRSDYGDLIEIAPNAPFGMGFQGTHFSEHQLIGMAYAFEQRTQVRKKITPVVVPKTELWDVVQARVIPELGEL